MSAPARTLTVSVELPMAAGAIAPDSQLIGQELRRLWIIEQVRAKRIGVGKGAELAGMPRAAFMQTLGAHGVPVIDYAPADLQAELDTQSAG
jgi:predicted HTH domain antitoxin